MFLTKLEFTAGWESPTTLSGGRRRKVGNFFRKQLGQIDKDRQKIRKERCENEKIQGEHPMTSSGRDLIAILL
jgi:hypothetical protein